MDVTPCEVMGKRERLDPAPGAWVVSESSRLYQHWFYEVESKLSIIDSKRRCHKRRVVS